jgi:hypothetical protein
MSNAKGFEVKFRDCCIRTSERQMDVMTVFIRKEGDLFSITVGGILKDKKTDSLLCYCYNLKKGDEITIERKAVEQTSVPIPLPDSYVPGKEPPDEANRQRWLTLYRDLEATLKAKGLI